LKEFNQSYIGIRKDLLCFIHGSDNVVLDVGCANGNNGKYLLDSGIAKEVYGIEYEKEMAAEAKVKYTTLFTGDLNESSFLENILKECPKVDYIIFGDVLEHLIDPHTTLKRLVILLKNEGKAIISLPNIAHVELFIQVYLKGTWPRNPRGIFDKTHLRWFTRKDAIEMVESSGLKVKKYVRKYRARDAKGSKFTWKYRLLKWLNKDWVTFQHLLICVKNG
jgi:2-polyprenyl-3-methyl-5-hydroxy-6-metoxy-1,4-benzoquinol methylase